MADLAVLERDVTAALAAAVTQNRIVGAVVAVAVAGRTVLLHAAGHADREAGRAMMPDAIFLLASVTKPVVSAAALALVGRGLFDLDTAVTDQLPAFRPRIGDAAPVITVRHLLTHTSGLTYPFQEAPDGPYHRADVSSGLDLPGLPRDEALRRLASAPLLFLPGTRWNYSLGVDVLGLFMERAAGRTLPEIVAGAVTGPLGLADTGFQVRDRARLVAHYGVDAAGAPLRMGETYVGPTLVSPVRMTPGRIFDPASYPSGGAGMAGTAVDLLAFVDALRRGGAPILAPSMARCLTTTALPSDMPDVMEPGWSYGCGAHTLAAPERNAGPERAGAFRGSGGYGAIWFADPALALSCVLLTNSAPEGVRGRATRDVRDAVYRAFG